ASHSSSRTSRPPRRFRSLISTPRCGPPEPARGDPMRPVTLTLIVHDHQPVGNFDGVIARACDDAYDPFLGFLERHPRPRIALHVSGQLLEWLAAHRRDHFTRLHAQIAGGQIEQWGG